ncbi:MAG: ATP-grasp domain-containing protein [Azospirillaceae bacterium]
MSLRVGLLSTERPMDMLTMQVVYALAATGARIVVIGDGGTRVASTSRYVEHYVVAPYPPATVPGAGPDLPVDRAALAAFAGWLDEHAAEAEIDVLMATNIETVGLLSAIARDVHVPTVPLAEPAVLARLHDKRRFAALAQELGLPMPETRVLPPEAGDPDPIRALGPPLVVKPPAESGGRGVRFAATAEAVAALVDTLPADTEGIAQRLVPGIDGGVGLLAWHGRIVAARYQEWRGPGELVFEDAPRAVAMAERVVAATGFSGLGFVDTRHDPETGDLRVIECNPRPWASIRAASASGVNMVALALDLAMGKPVEPAPAHPPVRVRKLSPLMRRGFAELLRGRAPGAGELGLAWRQISDPLPLVWNRAVDRRRRLRGAGTGPPTGR